MRSAVLGLGRSSNLGLRTSNFSMKVNRFEDIQAWQAARDLCRVLYNLSGESQFAKDFGLRDQARRAAVSIMANISEGFDCNSNQEFI